LRTPTTAARNRANQSSLTSIEFDSISEQVILEVAPAAATKEVARLVIEAWNDRTRAAAVALAKESLPQASE
jgi:hypothetical protein